MLAQIHQHILSELDRTVRADTVFVFGAVVLDVASIAVNSVLAQNTTTTSSLIFCIFIVAVAVVTFVAAAALRNGTKACLAYHDALMALYSREGVADFFPQEGIRRGLTRYRLYIGLVCVLGTLAVLVPLIVKIGVKSYAE